MTMMIVMMMTTMTITMMIVVVEYSISSPANFHYMKTSETEYLSQSVNLSVNILRLVI